MSLRSLTQLSLPFFLHSLRTLRSLLRPMTQVGVKASDKKWDRGNQNQNWVKTRTPTTEGMWVCPVLDCSEIVTLWPPVRNHKWINEFLGNSRRIPEWCIFKTDAVKGATSASQTTMLSTFSCSHLSQWNSWAVWPPLSSSIYLLDVTCMQSMITALSCSFCQETVKTEVQIRGGERWNKEGRP